VNSKKEKPKIENAFAKKILRSAFEKKNVGFRFRMTNEQGNYAESFRLSKGHLARRLKNTPQPFAKKIEA